MGERWYLKPGTQKSVFRQAPEKTECPAQLWGPPASQRYAEKEEPVKKIDLEQPELNKGTEEETSHKPRADVSRRRG